MKFLQNIHNAKLIFINFIIFIILFFVLDFITCFLVVNQENKTRSPQKRFKILDIYSSKFSFQKNDIKKYIYYKNYRPIENINSKKKPILIFGCSYAYGYNLKDNETFSYQLGKLTGRPIYNRAHNGRGLQHMYYQLQNNDFYDIVPKPEYVIYLFIPDQISRMYINTNISISLYKYTLLYKSINNKLARNRFSECLSNSSIYYLLNKKIHSNKGKKKINNKELKLLNNYFNNSYIEIIKHWGHDVKFVILLYPIRPRYNFSSQIKKLLDDKFIIVDIKKLNQFILHEKFRFKDGHPNAKAWEEITPLIVKELNLN